MYDYFILRLDKIIRLEKSRYYKARHEAKMRTERNLHRYIVDGYGIKMKLKLF